MVALCSVNCPILLYIIGADINLIFVHVQREPKIQVVDLCEDLKNGVALLTLLEVLSGETLVRNKSIAVTVCLIIAWPKAIIALTCRPLNLALSPSRESIYTKVYVL